MWQPLKKVGPGLAVNGRTGNGTFRQFNHLVHDLVKPGNYSDILNRL